MPAPMATKLIAKSRSITHEFIPKYSKADKTIIDNSPIEIIELLLLVIIIYGNLNISSLFN